MREIQILADRCRLSTGDLIALSREVAEDASSRVMGPQDLTTYQQGTLILLLRVLAAPVGERYFDSPIAA